MPKNAEKRTRVSTEDFVSTWVEVADDGGNIADVADKLGLKIESTQVRATALRKSLEEHGVELPKLTRRPSSRQKRDLSPVVEMLRQHQEKAKAALDAADEVEG